jgi:hypothetical protein
MTLKFRITRGLLDRIHLDLSRRHEFAYERVGFMSCAPATSSKGLILLGADYHPVEDADYEDGHFVGAMMGPAAIRKAMQFALTNNRAMFHIHRHEHRGIPNYSRTDLMESAKFIPDFFKVRGDLPHGTLLLSEDCIRGIWWKSQHDQPQHIAEIAVTGRPMQFMRIKA